MPTLTTPRTAFYTPTKADLDYNSDFWSGNNLGIPKAMLLTFYLGPDPKNYTYYDWTKYVEQFYKSQASSYGFPNDFNDGYDDAFETAKIYLWNNDPSSPHIKNYT